MYVFRPRGDFLLIEMPLRSVVMRTVLRPNVLTNSLSLLALTSRHKVVPVEVFEEETGGYATKKRT